MRSKLTVNFKDLKNGNRVREVISYQGEVIRVYEPTKEIMEEIFRMQEQFIDKEDINEIDVGGKDVIYLFKKLTDIEGLDDLTDEEIDTVIEDPTPALIMTQNVIEGIVTEIYKMVILSARNRMTEMDFTAKSGKLMNNIFDLSEAYSAQNAEVSEKMEKVKQAQADRDKAKKNVVNINKKKESKAQANNHGQLEVSKNKREQQDLLKEYQNEFE